MMYWLHRFTKSFKEKYNETITMFFDILCNPDAFLSVEPNGKLTTRWEKLKAFDLHVISSHIYGACRW